MTLKIIPYLKTQKTMSVYDRVTEDCLSIDSCLKKFKISKMCPTVYLIQVH